VARRDYLPARDAELLLWVQNYSAKITATPTAYGLTSGDATLLASLTGDFDTRLSVATTPATRTAVSIQAKNTSRTALKARCRILARIITADPDTTDAQALVSLVTATGYAVDAADCSDSVLQRLRFRKPSLVVLDCGLADSFELLTRIRAEPRVAATPVVMFSIDDEDVREKAMLRGADGYVPKDRMSSCSTQPRRGPRCRKPPGSHDAPSRSSAARAGPGYPRDPRRP